MRRLVLAMLLVACNWGHTPSPDARPFCCDAAASAPDAGACAPSGSCTGGHECGNSCCAEGEACVNGACMCGPNPACGVGDICAAGGAQGGDQCGSICCGASGPCPGVR
jgi:hypothetical protein